MVLIKVRPEWYRLDPDQSKYTSGAWIATPNFVERYSRYYYMTLEDYHDRILKPSIERYKHRIGWIDT